MNHLACFALSLFLSIGGLSQERPSSLDNQRFIQRFIPANREEAKREVARLLQSGSARDRAWAAHFIGQFELKELAPSLIEFLDSPVDTSIRTHNVALDGLIRMNVDVPSRTLMRLYRMHPEQVVILLARSPVENRDELFAIAHRPALHIFWVAACNLLAQTRAPGFAAFLLRELEVRVTVSLSNDGSGYGSADGLSYCRGCGLSGPPEDIPPHVQYELTSEPKGDATMFAPGAHPVYYERRVLREREGISSSDFGVERDRYTIDYLADILGKSTEEIKLQCTYSDSIVWAGSAKYRRKIERIRRNVKRDFEYVKEQLKVKGLLTSSEAEAAYMNLSIVVVDLRKLKLPQPPEIHGVRRVDY